MRQDILIVVVAALCLLALFKPFTGLLSYLWFGLMRPDVLAWATGAAPLSLILAIMVFIASLRSGHRFLVWLTNPLMRWFLLLQLFLLLSVVGAVDTSLSVGPYQDYLRIIAIPMLIPVLVRSLDDLRKVLLVVGLSLGAVGLKFGIWGLSAGGAAFSGGYGGMLADNNDMALAFVMTVVVCWYCQLLVDARWLRIVLVSVAFATAAAAIMTHSRGGALSFSAVLLMMIVRSRRKVGMLLLVALLIGPSIYLVRDSYFDRLSTMKSYQDDGSAMGRIENAKAAFAMWKDYPLLGVGFGMYNFVALSESYGGARGLVVHNTYMQTLVDDGIFAALSYVGLLYGTIVWLGLSARRVRRVDARLAIYPIAIQTALAAFAVGSTFLSRLQLDLLYVLLMSAAAWHPIEKRILAQHEELEEQEEDVKALSLKESLA